MLRRRKNLRESWLSSPRLWSAPTRVIDVLPQPWRAACIASGVAELRLRNLPITSKSLFSLSSSDLDSDLRLQSPLQGDFSGARAPARLDGEGSVDLELIRRLGQRALPPFPDSSLVRSVVVPDPPLLGPGRPEDRAELLGATYRSAVESRYDVRSFAFARGDPTTWRDFSVLCDAADRLEAIEVAPAAWILFSMDAWRQVGVSDGPPKPSWVFSLKRMRERFDWFEREVDRYCGGRVVSPREHLDLAERWHGMWAEILMASPKTREALLEVVDGYFPGDSFERQLDLARAASRRLQLEIDEAVASGVVLW